MKLQIFEPPMCCSTGICGPGVDPALVAFSVDLDWLKRQGVDVERFNLSQQPQSFVSNVTVTNALKEHGNDCLPLILIDNKIVAQGAYPTRDKLAQLAGIGAPQVGLILTVEESINGGSGCCSSSTKQGRSDQKSNKESCC